MEYWNTLLLSGMLSYIAMPALLWAFLLQELNSCCRNESRKKAPLYTMAFPKSSIPNCKQCSISSRTGIKTVHQKQKYPWNFVICLMMTLGHTSIKIIVFKTLFLFIFLYFKFNKLIFFKSEIIWTGGVKGKVNSLLSEMKFMFSTSENTKQISIIVTE